jgi:hypothetical protein
MDFFFSMSSRQALRFRLLPMVTAGYFLLRQSGRSVKLTTYLPLVPMLRIYGSFPPRPLHSHGVMCS